VGWLIKYRVHLRDEDGETVDEEFEHGPDGQTYRQHLQAHQQTQLEVADDQAVLEASRRIAEQNAEFGSPFVPRLI
jgi:hypothetical protein